MQPGRILGRWCDREKGSGVALWIKRKRSRGRRKEEGRRDARAEE